MQNIGIDDLSVALPSLYLPISELAEARGIEPPKLRHGLGLIDMALCDTDEDVVTLAAKAVIDLIERNNLSPSKIGRIYVGTESSVDGSKPIASYVLGLVAQYFKKKGVDASDLKHCDVVDMTFACIGAIDAMHNSLAWLLTQEDDTVAITVATDDAKYELDSTGEYTQGAGAVAVLLKKNPRLLTVDMKVGVGTMDEHDFFKPLRLKANPIQEVDTPVDAITVEHRDTPVFDGPYSNKTYANRIIEAWEHYEQLNEGKTSLDHYAKYIFHLPYAYHGRRIMPDLYFHDMKNKGVYDDFLRKHELEMPNPKAMSKDEYKSAARAFLKSRTKTPQFKNLITEKIEQGERLSSVVGNVYTASIFLALFSSFYHSREEQLAGEELLFIAYGSGSKSKVFRSKIVDGWTSVCKGWNIEKQLAERTKVSFDQYVDIRCHKTDGPLSGCKDIHQNASGSTPTNRYARYYTVE